MGMFPKPEFLTTVTTSNQFWRTRVVKGSVALIYMDRNTRSSYTGNDWFWYHALEQNVEGLVLNVNSEENERYLIDNIKFEVEKWDWRVWQIFRTLNKDHFDKQFGKFGFHKHRHQSTRSKSQEKRILFNLESWDGVL